MHRTETRKALRVWRRIPDNVDNVYHMLSLRTMSTSGPSSVLIPSEGELGSKGSLNRNDDLRVRRLL